MIYFHTIFTRARILPAFHLPLQVTHATVPAYGRIIAAFSLPQHSHTPLFSHTVAFSQLFHSSFTHAAVLAFCRIFAAFSLSQHSQTPLFSHAVVFSQLFHSPSIHTLRRSHTDAFSQVFYSLSIHTRRYSHTVNFAAFALSQHSHRPLFSHWIAFRWFSSLASSSHATVLAYNRIFAASTLSLHSHTPPLPPFSPTIAFFVTFALFQYSNTPLFSHRFAFCFICFRHSRAAVLAYDRIFALLQYSHTPQFSLTIAFSLEAFSHAAVLAYDRIFAAFTLPEHSHSLLFSCMIVFSQLFHFLLLVAARPFSPAVAFGRFSSLTIVASHSGSVTSLPMVVFCSLLL